ncbi:helix-turn-helix domain-containing protein [Arenibacter sp. F26102]|uniref:helix-turn-helix domain-containing protein n=1 Tax=Arenibacter sp. F26102 TaxID=2926416 RepID=UPI001FF5D7E3|nr:helix-turn-helix domain-containing protein [Arenibacter sp. F26102]MCK0148213.1 helix-turn-helix domain-containing protein [Arenibacter sp. F26102]
MKRLEIEGVDLETLEALLNKIVGKHLEELKKEYKPKEPTEFLTRHEVAELLKIDISSIANWRKSGKLQSYGIGGRVYFKRKEVEAAIIKIN